MAKAFQHVHAVEKNLMRRWSKEHKSIAEIAELLGRHKRTVLTHLKAPVNARRKTKGRPKAITPQMYTTLKRVLDRLLKKAGGQHEVTVDMVKEASGFAASARTMRKAFHEHGVRFRRLREKPILTLDDVVERRNFADRYFCVAFPICYPGLRHRVVCLLYSISA